MLIQLSLVIKRKTLKFAHRTSRSLWEYTAPRTTALGPATGCRFLANSAGARSKCVPPHRPICRPSGILTTGNFAAVGTLDTCLQHRTGPGQHAPSMRPPLLRRAFWAAAGVVGRAFQRFSRDSYRNPRKASASFSRVKGFASSGVSASWPGLRCSA